jgi:TP53 regulating kinase-like protein
MGMTLLKRGAESDIYLGSFMGMKAVFKKRRAKRYRLPELDERVNRERTISEARLIYAALISGVSVPAVLLLDPPNYLIVMEYIEGTTVKDLLQAENLPVEFLRELGKKIGETAARLHTSGIYHGDLTTSNLILSGEDLFLVDFGLAGRSNDIEDLGVDIHVFLRSLESVHPKVGGVIYGGFKEVYARELGDRAKEVLNRVKDIRRRGRYVEERRNSASHRK